MIPESDVASLFPNCDTRSRESREEISSLRVGVRVRRSGFTPLRESLYDNRPSVGSPCCIRQRNPFEKLVDAHSRDLEERNFSHSAKFEWTPMETTTAWTFDCSPSPPVLIDESRTMKLNFFRSMSINMHVLLRCFPQKYSLRTYSCGLFSKNTF